jgi:hypothetical protein
MAKEHEVKVSTRGDIVGRNGTYNLTAVSLFPCDNGMVKIDGFGKRGNAIHGGLWVGKEAMDALATDWLRMRGKP